MHNKAKQKETVFILDPLHGTVFILLEKGAMDFEVQMIFNYYFFHLAWESYEGTWSSFKYWFLMLKVS